jgi:hypothetical protein
MREEFRVESGELRIQIASVGGVIDLTRHSPLTTCHSGGQSC